MYGGSGAGLYFGLFSINELAAIVGAFVAVCGLAVQIWYTLQKNARAQELHRISLEGLQLDKTHGSRAANLSGSEED